MRGMSERPVTRGPNDDPSLSDDDLISRRTEWFAAYTSQKNVFGPRRGAPYTCPCCGHATLAERGVYEICGECGWEDDGQDNHDSHVVRGGPNGSESLDQGRNRYVRGGGVMHPHLPPSEAV
ncbi:CPCC family cysteine-rich protein [Actinoplanes sp. NPDC048988]|uniref:CPCC family cysteine-rich protein n=1 Tax=Actinoplanes sp. NPDC048988 TaxID=3363901 RepID=UPI003715D6D6